MSLPTVQLLKRTRRKSYHHGDLRAALTEAAIELVRKNGPEHLSLRAAADQVGVSPSAVYHYFPDKDSLVDAIGEKLFEDLAAMQREAFSQISGKSARAAKLRFRELGRTYFEWAMKEPNLFRLVFGGFCRVENQDENERGDSYSTLTHCLDDLLQMGVISPSMRKNGELLVWSAVHGASYLIIAGLMSAESFEVLLDAIELAMKSEKSIKR